MTSSTVTQDDNIRGKLLDRVSHLTMPDGTPRTTQEWNKGEDEHLTCGVNETHGSTLP
uniref:Uncharacterized protein n=1 Tax=Arion vulgaris TaxID=1028688 RepID=A0A0B7AT07_9EUPU